MTTAIIAGEAQQPRVSALLDGLFKSAPPTVRQKVHGELAAAEAIRAEGRRIGTIGVAPEQIAADVREAKLAARLAAWTTTAPPDYADARLNALDPEQHPEKLAAWLRSGSRTLWLTGFTGSGKTHGGWALLHAGLSRDYLVRGYEHNAYLASLRPGGSKLEPWVIRSRAQEADLLLLDDFGAEMEPRAGEELEEASKFVREETIMLLSERLRTKRRQIITTNLSIKTLGVLFGDRIISRLRQDALHIKFEGSDRRQAAEW